MKRFFFLFLFSLYFLLPVPANTEPKNIGQTKQKLIAYYQSGKYHQELSRTIKKAHKYIIEQAKHNKNNNKLAVILDIDETSLSNYKSLKRRDFSNNPAQIHKDIMQGDAQVITPMLSLYNDAIKHGVKVFFITGRKESERVVTIKNLYQAGYRKWSGLYLRSKEQISQPAKQFKSSLRAKIAKQGYVILATIGDQCSDIKGGYAKKGFKLPNPFYRIP